jgi:hypothetical protein
MNQQKRKDFLKSLTAFDYLIIKKRYQLGKVVGKRLPLVRDPTKPKHSVSAFFEYSKSLSQPGPVIEAAKNAGSAWNEFSLEGKQQFLDLAAQNRIKKQKELEEYFAKNKAKINDAKALIHSVEKAAKMKLSPKQKKVAKVAPKKGKETKKVVSKGKKKVLKKKPTKKVIKKKTAKK